MTSLNDKKGNGKNSLRIIASARDLAMLGSFSSFQRPTGHGGTAQIVPSSFMDTHYSDAIRLPLE
jgi:hypothetical protein